MRIKKSQSGFSAIEGLLLIVILGIIGFTGWYVWHSKQATNKTLSDAGSAQTNVKQTAAITTFDECKKSAGSKTLQTYPEQCVTKAGKTFIDQSDETAQWTQYTAPDGTYSMRIPDGWDVDQNSETRGELQIMDNSLAIKPGVKGTFYVTPGYGKDYNTGMTIYYYGPDDSSEYFQSYTEGATKQASLSTQDGVEIQSYFYKQMMDPGTPGLQKGDENYIYAIGSSGDKLVLCSYSFDPSKMTDYHTIVEAALETVKIL